MNKAAIAGFLLMALAGNYFPANAQSPRARVSFDYGWELHRIDPVTDSSGSGAFHRGTSFQSQFHDEHVGQQNESPDSIIFQEKAEAIRGFALEYPSIRSDAWEPVTLPCPARYENEVNPGFKQFSGICYYRKTFRIPPSLQGRELSLVFDGAMQVASVWVNGVFVLQHQGGYLPFSVPLDRYIRPDSVSEIIIRLDNRDNPYTPPGKPLARLGFLYWSGIYRDAWLDAVGPIHITDPIVAQTVAGGSVFVRYEDVSDYAAKVLIRTQVAGTSRGAALRQPIGDRRGLTVHQIIRDRQGLTVRQVIRDRRGGVVAQSESSPFELDAQKDIDQHIIVRNPHLWSPGDPYLYHLVTEVRSNGRVLDIQTRAIGIRSLSYSRWEGFKLNGKVVRIVGTNRHQDHPFVGNALSRQEQYRDLKRIKESGMNFVRLAHYPQDPSVFDICDSLGLMVADPIPGWQFFNRNGLFTQRVFRDIRELVRRDRNHPCIIMWEMSLNESYPPDSFRIASARIAHEEYPGDQFFTAGDTYASKTTAWDVPYNSWEDPFGRPQEVQPSAPGFVREYGHYEFGGEQSTTNASRSRGEQSLLFNAWNIQWEHNLLRGPAYFPWTIGDANWAFFDGFEAYTKGSTDWGVMDLYRIPKFSYYLFRSQLSPPMVYIANWWTPEDTTGKVVVYANTDSVALYLNGRLLAKQGPDQGGDTPYGDWDHGGSPFDGGNALHLDHPPFTFTHIAFVPGVLKAVGTIGGRQTATHIVRTPDTPVRLSMQADTKGMPLTANGSDIVFVHAALVDGHGTVGVLDNQTMVTFSVSGPGMIIGPSTVKARGGIASMMVRAMTKAGPVSLIATAQGLTAGHLEVWTVPAKQ